MKFDFPNSKGEMLSGRLDLPKGSSPRAFALFAHCFTCSKDIIAPSVVSQTLTDLGIGVLRFDFTGLGSSQGDFSNTNFSSNVEDLLYAYHHLSREHGAPEMLIGHSLGGAAVLKAATELEHVKAVVTIGAPSDVQHVAHLFENDLAKISADGEAKVRLAGREFTIKQQFIDDLNESKIIEGVRQMKKALLVMHAPLDNTVGIEHAGKIFDQALHPKSFVSLDSACHLLMNRADARYAAGVMGAWAQRYLTVPKEERVSLAEGEVLVQSRKGYRYTNDVLTAKHTNVADEPEKVKGADLGMGPYEYVMAGLGACTSMTLKMYAERKGLDLSSVQVKISHEKIPKNPADPREGKVDQFTKSLSIQGDLTPEQRARCYEIAEMCPVNKTLLASSQVQSIHPKETS